MPIDFSHMTGEELSRRIRTGEIIPEDINQLVNSVSLTPEDFSNLMYSMLSVIPCSEQLNARVWMEKQNLPIDYITQELIGYSKSKEGVLLNMIHYSPPKKKYSVFFGTSPNIEFEELKKVSREGRNLCKRLFNEKLGMTHTFRENWMERRFEFFIVYDITNLH